MISINPTVDVKEVDIKEKIRQVVLGLIPDLKADELLDSSDIFELGLDSINAMTLVLNLQDAFDIKFEASEIDVENFRNIADMTKLIGTKV